MSKRTSCERPSGSRSNGRDRISGILSFNPIWSSVEQIEQIRLSGLPLACAFRLLVSGLIAVRSVRSKLTVGQIAPTTTHRLW